jgi:RND family efflux transporter MFP subunit
MTRLAAFVVLLAAAGCGEREEGAVPTSGEFAAVQVGPEDVASVERGTIVLGPILSGELRARREATVRAEVSGPLSQVLVEEGQTVRRGALLGRISARELDDARRSAQTAVRSAEAQLELARREASRTESLVSAGALAPRDLDTARAQVSNAEAQLADARSRLATAASQVGETVLRAPIDGIVSDRAVNTGDVVSPGSVLFTIIDPSSMRLEASVPSASVGDVRVGAPVEFTVAGYDQPFEGRIERINPQADPVTRQVPIYVSIPNVDRRLVAGLFAEGRAVLEQAEGPIAPADAVSTQDGEAWVLRVREGAAERVPVTVGLRDERTERVLITSGVEPGDVLLRGTAQAITSGTPVRIAEPVS